MTSDLEKDEDLERQLYETVSYESKIKTDIVKNVSIISSLIKERKSYDTIEKILNYTKAFNDSIKQISNEELNFLYSDLKAEDSLSTNQNDNSTHLLKVENLCYFDYFNTLNLNDMNLLLLGESLTNSELQSALKLCNLNSFPIEQSFLRLFNLEKKNTTINPFLLNKCELVLGKEETENVIRNFNRVNDLSFLQYNLENRKLVQEFGCKAEQARNEYYLVYINNLDYLCKSNVIPKEKYSNKIKRLFPNLTSEKLSLLNNLVDYLYQFRVKVQSILKEYHKELSESLKQTELIIEESISDEVENLKTKIQDFEFKTNREEVTLCHLKNKEIYQIKEKMKNEQNAALEELTRRKKEKEEQEKKMYYTEIKKVSEYYTKEQKVKKEQEQSALHNIKLQKAKLLKEEVKTKLPKIEKRQIEAEMQFVSLQKQKEKAREDERERQNQLNKIIENLKIRPNVEPDFERVKRITQSLKIRYETARDEADKIVLFSNPGFTVDNLMSDMRYKISSALSEAGLINSAYANQMLRALSNTNTNNNL